MDFQLGVTIGAVVGVAIGLAIHLSRQRRLARVMKRRIREELASAGSLSLPELVTRVGLRDGFFSRGKVMTIVAPMVAAGELVQDEPPGTTVKNRLCLLRFRLGAVAGSRVEPAA